MSQEGLLQRLLTTVGEQGYSDWHVITQDQVARHAELSGDGQGEWIHLDPRRAARDAPYGGTIVQGFFQVAHLIKLGAEAIRGLAGLDPNYALNYGFDRLRFVRPMPVGSRFRANVRIAGVSERPQGGCVLKQQVCLELENGDATLVADWLSFIGPLAIASLDKTGAEN
jgi:acyl dehydratase